MRLKVLACKVLYRELGLLSASCPNFLDITYLRQGFHDEPQRLQAVLQAEIDKLEAGDDPYSCDKKAGDFDAICLLYGLCSNGIVGLHSKKYPIVIPRAHDCITLFLGSKERYREYFDKHPGTFWYTKGWVENTVMPGTDYYKYYFDLYADTYGEENAEFLAEENLRWLKEYNMAAYISMPGVDDGALAAKTKENADYLQWQYDELPGSYSLLSDMLLGKWEESRFLTLQPGDSVQPSYDELIIK